MEWIIGGIAAWAALVVAAVKVLGQGKQEDHARWRSMGYDPEQVENEIESEALAEWQDRQTIKAMEKDMRRDG